MALDATLQTPENSDVADNAVKSLRRENVVKTGKTRLREWLDSHDGDRVRRAIRHRFGTPGEVMTPQHRSKAAAFLRSIIQHPEGKESRLFAAAFAYYWLPPPDGNCSAVVVTGTDFEWRVRDGLERVFEEYPGLCQAFESWLRAARNPG